MRYSGQDSIVFNKPDPLKLIVIISISFGASLVSPGSKQVWFPKAAIVSGPSMTAKWQLTVVHVVTQTRRYFERKAQTIFN
jgi:hypothetical protein